MELNKETIMELIANAPQKFFVGALDESRINGIEERLKVKLPDSYKWFLKEYGTGGGGAGLRFVEADSEKFRLV
ncbi:SMI1/KNR4 family protein [Brevibacillus sp. 179-C9.3 HS]|uniref:SMI1/KNR4 family protein n=1 Tax=unclassified Brevibacillus TaxID=2684853 RepID=UPI0039A29233